MNLPCSACGHPQDQRRKVVVLTFHFHYNYGGVLQAYGMQQALARLGYVAVFPSTVPSYCSSWISQRCVLDVRRRGLLNSVAVARKEYPRRQAFDRFRQRYFRAAVAGPSWEDAIADPGNVAVIVGGDQVWNLKWMNSWDPYYFLGLLPLDAPIRRLAYGACFGTMAQRVDYLQLAAPLLQQFSFIGARTETTRRIVESNTSRCAVPVVDPAMLHDFLELNSQRSLPTSFILFYGVRPEAIKRGRDIAMHLRGLRGIPIVLLIPESYALESWPDLTWADHILGDADPADWLEAIRSCSFLVTDSFHASLFALLFQRPFLAYPQGESAERIVDVTKRYGLGHRLIGGNANASDVEAMLAPVDFGSVKNQLLRDRDQSLQLLSSALSQP